MTDLRQVVIHCHWYQPPRENPFTGKVDDQPSASPFRNWNERIAAECYAPNANAEIRNGDGQSEHQNNYEWVSSDWGPTLLSWLENQQPDVYRSVIEADRATVDRFGGHGSTIAHAYNHTILPLSNDRDKRTQVKWGIADFVHRFGREPEGMWLPETAADVETLAALSEQGIRFTVLSPFQADSVMTEEGWADVTGGKIDTSTPYVVDLPNGAEIAVFFYDGPISQDIAFGGLLEDGVRFGRRLIEDHSEAALKNVATDGETYGHHHRHGEMALARAIREVVDDPGAEITNYAQLLANDPPHRRARILEVSSWSCAHGVERWRSDCGCSISHDSDWNQAWRTPLRDSLDWLRDALADDFETTTDDLFEDPWAARDRYIEVILGGDDEAFLNSVCVDGLTDDQRDAALALLEVQHRSMLMFTSCGWFFDELAGLETIFVLRHAGRAIGLARNVTGRDHEAKFLNRLEHARGNVDGLSGRDVYEANVSPWMTEDQIL